MAAVVHRAHRGTVLDDVAAPVDGVVVDSVVEAVSGVGGVGDVYGHFALMGMHPPVLSPDRNGHHEARRFVEDILAGVLLLDARWYFPNARLSFASGARLHGADFLAKVAVTFPPDQFLFLS